jgi:hypothetical protein
MPREGIPYVYSNIILPISNNCDTSQRKKFKKDG